MIDLDRELSEKAFTARERVAIRLLLIYMVYPARYNHQFDKFFDSIKQDLAK